MYSVGKLNIINRITAAFYLSGLWVKGTGDVSHKLRTLGSRCSYLFLLIVYTVVTALGACLQSDMSEILFLTALSISSAVIWVKIIYILWRKDEIQEITNDISAHFVIRHDKFMEIKEKLRQFTIYSYIFLSAPPLALGCIIILSLQIFWGNRQLPLKIWFPMDWKDNNIGYWLATITQYLLCYVYMLACCLSVLVWYLMLNCSIKYEVLGQQFRNLGETTDSDTEKPEKFSEKLIELIKTHQILRKRIDRFTSSFSFLFFSHITTGGLCLCCFVYGAIFTQYENLFQIALYVQGIIYNIFDIFMIMYFGNEIKVSSDRLSYFLFECKWIDQSPSCKKNIIILTEVLKKPHQVVIAKLYVLNLDTFTKILNLAYSSFNILRNLK